MLRTPFLTDFDSRAAVKGSRDPLRNLIGFPIDKRGRLIAESSGPKAGLSAEEFQFFLKHFAIEADRYEYMLSGKDTH